MTAISPSSSSLTTHLPAFAVLREIAGFGIVRATRGNHSRCHAPSSGRAGMSCENRGGVLMESGDGARVKTAISRSGGFNPPPTRLRAYTLALPTIPHSSIATIAHSSIAIDPQGGSASLCRSGLITVNRGGALMDLRITRKMKIIQFSKNIDKLTSYFDKYLKTNGLGLEAVSNTISISYVAILKYETNILSKCIELKKILRPPHFPAIARICARA